MSERLIRVRKWHVITKSKVTILESGWEAYEWAETVCGRTIVPDAGRDYPVESRLFLREPICRVCVPNQL